MPSPKRPGDDFEPGAVVRSIRTGKGLTLSQLGQRTGLPTSTLSKIENGKLSLTYDKLTRISAALEVDIAELFAPRPSGQQPNVRGRRSITRAGDGKLIETKNYGHRYHAADLLHKRFTPLVAVIRARSLEEFGELIQHSGEEYTFVLEGEIELHTDIYAPVHLRAGDSIYFNSETPHAYIAVGDGPGTVVSVCSGPEAQLIDLFDAGEPAALKPVPRKTRLPRRRPA